ncbi:neuroguidin-like isoform X1 [Porites lutea]|uniref:neuroguidin-like isoform X1 n=2 Tax=Porites lutea TaxID=51062 RepID=UPI003CC6880B
MAAEELIARDLPDVISTMREMGEKVSDIDQHVEKLMEKITSGSLLTKKGVSFLEVKFHLLLSYVIDLTYYLLTKTDGKSWQGDPAVERLVEARTVLEKMRPIDQKMKYQIDKMIKAATTGIAGGGNDPLRFKPNPDNMATKLDDQDSESSDEEDGQKKSKVYVPPKVAAVPYDEDGDKKTRKEKDEERSRKRVLASSLLQDLRDEYSEGPQEIRDETVSRWRKQKDKEEEEERTRYEEDNLLRLPAKRKKKMTERAETGLDDLTSFANLSALDTGEENGDYSERPRNDTRKSKSKWKKKFGSAKKKKGFAKRRRR